MKDRKQSSSPSGYDRDIQPRHFPNRHPWNPQGQAGMDVRECLIAFTETYEKIARDRISVGLGPLEDADFTWGQRANTIMFLLKQPDVSQHVLATVGAQVVAWQIALSRAEEVDSLSGDAA